jgi:hypothetical protein
MSTPDLYLQTAFVLNEDGRIISTREPEPKRGPAFCLVRSTTKCAWAMRADLPQKLSDELDSLAREEPPTLHLRDVPLHAEKYISLVGGRIESGPAFVFPDTIAQPSGIVFIEELRLLDRYFRGWTAEEIPGRLPIAAILEDWYAVSICFSARLSDIAAEAGLETATTYRGRGFGPRVAAAWALAIRASGRIPLYSTPWTNLASLAVARKLGLVAYASTWGLSD